MDFTKSATLGKVEASGQVNALCAVMCLTQVAHAVTKPVMTETTTPSAANVAELSFEAALEELGRIVRQLEEGQVPLDAAISLYERATTLKAHCDARLRNAESRIERIRLSASGEAVGTAPLDAG